MINRVQGGKERGFSREVASISGIKLVEVGTGKDMRLKRYQEQTLNNFTDKDPTRNTAVVERNIFLKEE